MIEDLKNIILKEGSNKKNFFILAEKYEKKDQLASAITFYMHAAESSETVIKSASLVRAAYCYFVLGDRMDMVKTLLNYAGPFSDDNPFFYWFKSIISEIERDWISCYNNVVKAKILLENSNGFNRYSLANYKNLSYSEFTSQCLYQLDTSLFWIGKIKESEDLFITLSKNINEHPDWMQKAININLQIIAQKNG